MRILKHFTINTFLIGILVVIIMLWCSSQVQAANKQIPDIEWEKAFSINGQVLGCYVQPTNDGGYIAMGNAASNANGWGIYIVKTDSQGNNQWQKELQSQILSNPCLNSVRQTTDGGYIIVGVGSNKACNDDVYLVKLDSKCNMQWEKNFDNSVDYNNDGGQSIELTEDGGYIILGYTGQWGSPNIASPYILKIDANGNLQWNKVLGTKKWTTFDAYTKIIRTVDGGYCIVGSSRTINADYDDICLIKIDASGNTQWEKFYGKPHKNDKGTSIIQSADGGIIVLASSESYGAGASDIYLFKVDGLGNILWEKTYGGAKDDSARSLKMTIDRGYIILGKSNSFTSQYIPYLIKIDNLGNEQWEKTWGTSNLYGEDVYQTNDGGYIVTGTCDNNSKLYLCKLREISNALKSISITAPASKLIYKVGDTLDISGLVVTGTYEDGSTKAEPVSASDVTGFNSSVAAVDQVLAITIDAKTVTYKVQILAGSNNTFPTKQDVPVDKVFKINFSQVVDPNTLKNNIKVCRIDTPNEETFDITPVVDFKDSKNVLVNHTVPYLAGASYRLDIGTGIKDQNGQCLSTPTSMRFITETSSLELNWVNNAQTGITQFVPNAVLSLEVKTNNTNAVIGWSVTGGTLSDNSGKTNIWTLPFEAGDYTISVNAQYDNKTVSISRNITVSSSGEVSQDGHPVTDGRYTISTDKVMNGYVEVTGEVENGTDYVSIEVYGCDTNTYDQYDSLFNIKPENGQINQHVLVRIKGKCEVVVSEYIGESSQIAADFIVTNLNPNFIDTTVTDSYLSINMPVYSIATESIDILVTNVDNNSYSREYLKPNNGELICKIPLRFGPGKYEVRYDGDNQFNDSNMSNKSNIKIEVVNTDKRDLSYSFPTYYVNSDDPEIISLAQTITKGLNSDYDKTKAIHDWVAHNIAYDTEQLFSGSVQSYKASEILLRKRGVCDGYAKLTAALNRAVGLRAKYVEGVGININAGEDWDDVDKTKPNHAWNEVFIDNRWVVEDTTWDAGNVVGTNFDFSFRNTYFDPLPEDFAKDHYKIREDGY